MKANLNNRNIRSFFSLIILLVGIISMVSSCEKDMEGKVFQVYEEYMIDEIMAQKSDLSEFLKVVDKAGFRGTIHAYGAYTLFAPNNEGVQTYLNTIGKASVDALTKQEAENMVKYHIILDTLNTSTFVDGRLVTPTFTNRYLTSKAVVDGDKVSYMIDRKAKIVEKDLLAANGYVHVIDHVLDPPTKTIAEEIRGLSPDYSLMKDIVAQSGFAAQLDKVEDGGWYTFFLQDNEAFKKNGITTIPDLLDRLKKDSPELANDEAALLYNYVAYHTIPSLNYVADLLTMSSALTMAEKQVLTFKREQDKILLNEFIQNGVKEEGVPLDRNSIDTDKSCSNGVLHRIEGNIEIKKRAAYRIYWDLAEQPEIMALKTFRKYGSPAVWFTPGELSEITWEGTPSISYQCPSIAFNNKGQYAFGDYLNFRLGLTTIKSIEYKTPVLIEGRYKVWLCHRMMIRTGTQKAIFKQNGFDDQVLNVINVEAYTPSLSSVSNSHDALELAGWKQYTAKEYNTVMASLLVGIIEVQTTGRHVLRFEPLGNGYSTGNNYDMIQFIPVDEDQQWPRIDMTGKLIYEDTPECEIYGNTPCVPVP